MKPFEDRYATLLARRVAVETVEIGRAYVIHARNGGVGVAVREDDRLGYRLHREKFGRHYLCVEWDWAEGPPYGTAIPLLALDARPPEVRDDADAERGERELLGWLAAREDEHKSDIEAAWRVILGDGFETERERS